MRAILRCAACALIVLGAGALVACTGTPSEGPRSQVTTSPPSSASEAPAPAPDPVLQPEGSAQDNLPYFDFVNSKLLKGGGTGGRTIIDNLVSAGFDKTVMEVTADLTPLGSDVDSLQFSVRAGEECLIGQTGAGGYTSTVAPTLETGSCLIGKTRAIDW